MVLVLALSAAGSDPGDAFDRSYTVVPFLSGSRTCWPRSGWSDVRGHAGGPRYSRGVSHPVLIAAKLVFGLLGFSSLVVEVAALVERGRFNPANFFSFFTIQTNSLMVASLLLSAVFTAAGTNRRLGAFRAAVTVYLLVVGICFPLLLAGLDGIAFTAVPWDNVVLHYVMPAIALVDFLVDRPVLRIGFSRGLWWLLFPLGYLGYTLLRGPIVDWYPYPFLDPRPYGYAALVVPVAGVMAVGLAMTWLVTRLAGGARRR
jgi:hypothetical protein